jgi:hypothetical protein
MNKIKKPSEGVDQAMELGILLGRRQAFSAVAGRCTAAQVDAMRRMRDGKLYLQFAPNWGEYCLEFLKVTGRHTNRQIACLNEFGPAYFELAQITGITPAAYRRIAPAVRSDGIHVGGEIVTLIPANAGKAAQAVACLLAEADAEAKAPPRQDVTLQLAALERRGRQVANTLASLAKSDLSVRHRQALLNTVQDVRLALLRVEMAML